VLWQLQAQSHATQTLPCNTLCMLILALVLRDGLLYQRQGTTVSVGGRTRLFTVWHFMASSEYLRRIAEIMDTH
jgi:hypothetical protein